jgi:hypothetical protein
MVAIGLPFCLALPFKGMAVLFSINTWPFMPCGSMQKPMSIGAKQNKRQNWMAYLRMEKVCLKLHFYAST